MSNTISNIKAKNKRDTLENWESSNYIPYDGELIVVEMEDGEVKLKLGNGVDTFNDLSYIKGKKPLKLYLYGIHINPNESDPSNAVTYLEDAVGMTPAKMGNSTFDYGSFRLPFLVNPVFRRG